MRLILREDVTHVGKSGEVVTVKDGFGRNFLLPQGLAVLATEKNVKQVEHQKKLITARNAKLAKDAQAVADKLSGVEVTIYRQAGEHDKLFGSVSARDIQDALQQKGVNIDRKKILLHEPIKALGSYSVDVKLGQSVVGKIKVEIASQA